MEDKKKLSNEEIKNEELTDEQANNVTGGASSCSECGKNFSGAHPFYIGGERCCATCYSLLVRGQEQPQRRNAKSR